MVYWGEGACTLPRQDGLTPLQSDAAGARLPLVLFAGLIHNSEARHKPGEVRSATADWLGRELVQPGVMTDLSSAASEQGGSPRLCVSQRPDVI